jgi:hypothetical protein
MQPLRRHQHGSAALGVAGREGLLATSAFGTSTAAMAAASPSAMCAGAAWSNCEAGAEVVGGLDEAGDEAAAQAGHAAQLGELAQVGDGVLPAGEVGGRGREVAGEDALVAAHAVALARGAG